MRIVLIFFFFIVSCNFLSDPPRNNKDYKRIIGKPILIGNLEIAEYDFPNKMSWVDALNECAALGDDWHLPSKDELNKLYRYKDKIGSFNKEIYWSSSGYNYEEAWAQSFNVGSQLSWSKNIHQMRVRAIRAF